MVDPFASTNVFQKVVDACIDVTHKMLETAAWLLTFVEENDSKDSKAYRDTLDQVRVIYWSYYGKIPDALLHTLMKVNAPN